MLDELFERQVQAADGGLRFGGFEAGGLRGDGALAVGEENFRRDFRNGFDDAHAVLRMAYVHADMQGFDFHG